MKKRSLVTLLVTILFSVLFLFVGYKICKVTLHSDNDLVSYKAKVTSITKISDSQYSFSNAGSSDIHFEAEVLNGVYKGEKIKCVQIVDNSHSSLKSLLKVGDKVVVTHHAYTSDYDDSNVDTSSEKQDTDQWDFVSYYRAPYLILLTVLFFLLILFIGRSKGIRTIIALVITCLSIFLVYIPSALKGYNLYLMTVIISVFIITSSLIIINGINKKTICAILGNISGVAISALLCLAMNHILRLTGLINEDYSFLQVLNLDKPINLVAVAWGGIVIGCLGAIMDVSMSIASSIHELSHHVSNNKFFTLYKSGMNIGKDAIGTMTNTLILAYIGSSFATVLLIIANHCDMLYIFNSEMIAVDILNGIIGSIGILIAVPTTALISSRIYSSKGKFSKLS